MAEETRPPRVDMRERNKSVIADYRANAGKPATGRMPLVLLTTTGAKSGKPHTTPVCAREWDGALIVAGSKGGMPTHPQWYTNLVAHPEPMVEYLAETYQARASTAANSPDRDRMFNMMSEVIVDLYQYQDRCRDDRQIAIVFLERI